MKEALSLGQRLALSPSEAAELLGLSLSTVKLELASGRLQSVKVGNRRIVPRWAIDTFLKTPKEPNDTDPNGDEWQVSKRAVSENGHRGAGR